MIMMMTVLVIVIIDFVHQTTRGARGGDAGASITGFDCGMSLTAFAFSILISAAFVFLNSVTVEGSTRFRMPCWILTTIIIIIILVIIVIIIIITINGKCNS